MVFGSESEESEGVTSMVASTNIPRSTVEIEKTVSKSIAYWKSEETNNPDAVKKRHQCFVQGCNASFSRPWRLKAHLSVHIGKKPFPCDVKDCSKAYTSLYHLRRHKVNVHEPISSTSKRFKCEFSGCLSEFKTRQNAKKHFKRIHELKTCEECGEMFKKRRQLASHQFEHTGIKPFKCATCDAEFLKKLELRRHERKHKTHICPEKGCFLTFTSWRDMRKHINNTHPKNYVCILCRKSYIYRRNLKEHILKHSDPEFPKRRVTFLQIYQCLLCSATLTGKASLKRHISVIHEGKPSQQKKIRTDTDQKKPRAPRKDIGSIKRAIAPVLADIKVPYPVEKTLLHRTGDDMTSDEEVIKIVHQHLKQLEESVEESSNEEDSEPSIN